MHDMDEYQQSTSSRLTPGNDSRPAAVDDHGHVAAFQQPNVNSQQRTTNQPPKFQVYVDIENRRRSFSGWPHLLPEPDTLAKAGFFYTGSEDHVRCAFCGIGLKHWEISDVPWIEHAYWSPKCFYVVERRGNDFIRLVHCIDLRTTLDDQSPKSSLTTEETANELEKLKEESRRLKHKMKCIRCRNKDICMLFVNCGHRQTCEECSYQMEYCPICEKKIEKRLKTFLS
ncbi:BIRC7_8 [Mytilus coruscus]|uniref:BIRC7_8 n=1 Tax=Mytilus coruscus TaxID=42192 RepID=A0A6J8CSH7_MYTCO|nr:BIRC7_8 [Mytilus coruscus]